MNPGKPLPGEYLEYFDTYISLVTESNVMDALEGQVSVVRAAINGMPADQFEVLHAPYTWTLKQVIGHCIDTERVFAYRAARFAAGDEVSLPGFDQDSWVANTDYNACEMGDLVDELDAARNSSLYLLRRQSEESWLRGGLADGKRMTVRAAAYAMAGHIRYHLSIIKKRVADV